MVISILVGPKFIEFLRRNEFGQHIREEGPQHHVEAGNADDGRAPDPALATVAFLAVSNYKVPALTVLFVTLGCGAIGFLDDFIKFTHRRSLGLRALEAAAPRADHRRRRLCRDHQHLPRSSSFPRDWNIALSTRWYVFSSS